MSKNLFVSPHRSINVGSTLGHSIAFKKGEPTYVVREMHALVMEKGCFPCDEKGKILDVEETPAPVETETKVKISPEDPAERKAAILAVVKALVEENNPHNFSGGGVPSAQSVTAALGWKVDQREIRVIWTELKPELAKKPE